MTFTSIFFTTGVSIFVNYHKKTKKRENKQNHQLLKTEFKVDRNQVNSNNCGVWASFVHPPTNAVFIAMTSDHNHRKQQE